MPAGVRVRMYRQGLGDCFLLTFGGKEHLLLDCGSIGRTKGNDGADLAEVVKDIVQEVKKTGGKLAAVVATHEHEDHVSGFRNCIGDLRNMDVAESWQAWTEDASDKQARGLEKYEGDLLHATALAGRKLSGLKSDPALSALGDAVGNVLAFNGVADFDVAAAKAKSNQAMTNALQLGKRSFFLSPGSVFERPWAPGVRFYVLGPTRDETLLHQMGQHGSADLYDFGAALPGSDAAFLDRLPFEDRLRLDQDAPGVRLRCARTYDRKADAWRRIDSDWLGVGADFALQLDSYTNNTSLALALEVDGKVLLFPGDAQLGSWISWQKVAFQVTEGGATRTVTGEDLLKRTVFYKVGHHSSHNATATAMGLELMNDEGLVAFIPLDGAVADHKAWHMPATHLYARLLERTRGRVLRSDLGWPDAKLRPDSVSESTWNDARTKAGVQVEQLYIEYEL